MLPGVKNTIKDGALGVLGTDATGQFAAVGVGANYGGGLLSFNAPDQVEETIGDGPLRDLLVSALSISRTTVYALALEGTVPGTLSAVTAGSSNSGEGTVSVSGSPRNAYQIKVEVISPGALNEATFRLTIDGLSGKELTTPSSPATYLIPGTGITLTFLLTSGTFASGDTFSFSTTAPTATNAEVLAAIDTILEAKLKIEWLAVAGVSDATLWAALAGKAESAAEIYQYLFFIVQARYKNASETLDQWVTALCGSERGSFSSTRLCVCAGWIEEVDVNGQLDLRPLIGSYCGKLAARAVHQGPDAVRYGPITAATLIKPDGIKDSHIETLKNSGYVTARQIIGLNGIYITSGELMSEEGSDFNLVERRRVMDKACREVRTAQLIWVNDAVKVAADGSPEGIKMLIAQSEMPLKTMITNGEISSGYIMVPEGQNILSTGIINTKVRIVPLGKLTYIENEIAFSNPATGGNA